MENMENQEPTTPTPKAPKNSGGVGPVLSIIVIIILLALGGLYYFTTGINKIPSYGTSNDGAQVVSDLEQEVDNTNLDEVDTLLNDIDADLQQI